MSGRRSILIVGCGAIGGIFAASLSRVADVACLDTHAEHVRAIREQGLQLTGLTQCVARVEACETPDGLSGRSYDAVLFLTKSSATAPALAALRPILSENCLLVTFQNGMGNSEVLMASGRFPVARGVTMEAGRYLGPGRIEHLISGQKSTLGPVRGSVNEIQWLGDLLGAAGIPTDVIANPMDAVWAKFVFNSVMNPVGALLLGVNAARYQSPEVCALIDDMAQECINVVHALGGRFAYDPMDFVKKVRSGALPMSKHGGSMSLDVARGTATEIEELTGYVVREGDRLGVDVSVCRTVYRLVKGLEIASRIARV